MKDENKSQSQLLKDIKKLRNQIKRLEKVKQDQVHLIENLRENEEKYKNLFEHAADMIVVINPRGKIINLNSAFERESHYKKREMLGKNIFTCGLLTKHSITNIRKQLSAILQGKPLPLIEIEGITKKGDIKPFELKAHLYKRGGKAFAIEAILRNISERKRVEEDLRESENKFRTIVENSHAGLCIIDSDFRITYLNDQFAQIFSIKREKLINKDFRKFLDAKTVKFLAGRFKQRQRGEPIPRSYETKLVQKNGTELDLEINASVILDSGGRINTVAQILDITERKKLEAQFRQVQKMEAVGQLAGGVAHDFNNILTVINGYAEIGLKKVEKNHPIRLYLNEILKSGKRAEKFTRQLLGFSRKQLIELKSLNINDVLKELGTMLRRLIGEDIDMVTKFGKDIALIKADPGQIEQILVNLAVNARDAINFKTDRAAEKKIIIETDHKYLDESYVNYHAGSRLGQHVVLVVSDTGVGMNLTVKNRIFEPFFTTKGREKGTGLGLSTVYGIVKQNNGSIYVYSEPDKGTTVKIYWPSELDKSIKHVQRRRKSDLAIGTENILIAEDDEGVKSLVSDALISLGYTVYSASNGVEALKILRNGRKKVNLLITDIIMPEMGGKELVEKITSAREDLKVLFTSGYTDAHIVRQGILEDGINFIQKPYSIQALAKKVREVLDQA